MASKSIPQKKLTGAELARLALAAIPKDRTGTSLREHIGEAQTTFGDTDEFTVFCATIQNALRGEHQPIPKEPLATYLDAISSAVLAIKNLAGQDVAAGGGGEDGALGVAIQALAEKAGFITDLSLNIIDGGPGCVGDFEAWADLNRNVPEAPEEEEASA